MGRLTSGKYASNQVHDIRDIDRTVTVSISQTLWVDAYTRGRARGKYESNQVHDIRDVDRLIAIGIAAFARDTDELVGAIYQYPPGGIDRRTPLAFRDTHMLRRPICLTSI
jgi:hypothetical protein